MPPSWPGARRSATVLAACVAMGLAAQSCAVMSSSSDCADKAACPDDGGGTSSGGGGAEGATGDDAPGQGDDTADAIGAADVTVDQIASSDARSEDAAALQDVASGADARLDVSLDVAADRAVDAPADAFDGCIATGPEVCTNGIDDNCDGKIDCADTTACGGYTCATAVPSGWIGPVLLWTGASTATAPACPTGYATAFDANTGTTGTADTCGCTCTPTGQTCAAAATLHVDQACSLATCATATTSGACSPVSNIVGGCGLGGSIEVGQGAAVAPSGGTCNPVTTTTMGSAPGWMTSARICALAGPADTPGGCNPSNETCVPASPGGGSGFASTPCVYQSGNLACPSGYPNGRSVVYAGETDSRACAGCACTTSTPSGGACAGTISIFNAANCAGAPATPPYTLGSVCQAYNLTSTPPVSVSASFTVTPGACTVATQATPTGSVTPTGPTTVCCM